MNLSRVAEIQAKAGEALRYASEAMDLSKRAGDKSAEAWSYLYLGHAHTLMNEFEEAKTAFDRALGIRAELGQSALATEPMAGLIQVALHINDFSLAKGLMENLLSYLLEGEALDAVEEPLRVYLACYNVLELLEDPRSVQILNKAMELLEAQLLKINDEKARRMYIENVPWRRAIESAWLAKKGNP